jgi:hypothetical protein
MLDLMIQRRSGFRRGTSVRLADGNSWILADATPSESEGSIAAYNELIGAVAEADDPVDLLRAELAFGIFLLAENYVFPPLILGGLLGFPCAAPELAALQAGLHVAAIEHLRAFRPVSTSVSEASQPVRIFRRFGLFNRTRASISA